MTATKTDTVALPLVRALEAAWKAIQAKHPEVPDVVVTIGKGQQKGQTIHGWFAKKTWLRGTTEMHELFIGGESLKRGPVPLLGTLLHEAAHALAEQRGITDTSRGGRYHNGLFQTLAAEMGIDVQKSPQLGWSTTTVPLETERAYSRTVRNLREAMVAYRVGNGLDGGVKRPSNNNGVTAQCACEKPRKIRLSLTVAEQGSIICGVCLSDFKILERPEK